VRDAVLGKELQKDALKKFRNNSSSSNVGGLHHEKNRGNWMLVRLLPITQYQEGPHPLVNIEKIEYRGI